MGFADVMGFYRGLTPLGIEIPNKGWESGDAGGWTLWTIGFGGVEISTTLPRSGTYSLRCQSASAFGGSSGARYDHPNWRAYLGKTIEFSIYNQKDPTRSVGSSRYIAIDDGDTITQQTFTPATGIWSLTTVQHTVSLNATMLRFWIFCAKVGGGPTYGWYIDDMDAKIIGA